MTDRIALIGPGRLGRTLHTLLAQSGEAPALLGRGGAPRGVDVVVLTVPDGAIAQVAAELAVGPVVLHCSGAHDLTVLAPHTRAGSMHPLMTFPGPEVAIPALQGVPAAIAGHPDAMAAAHRLAKRLGLSALDVRGDRRLYHAAAVLAGNFATVLLAEAGRALAAAGVAPEAARRALLPLAMESLRNAATDPGRALTGPVARGDHATLVGHRDALLGADLADIIPLVDALEIHGQALLERARKASET